MNMNTRVRVIDSPVGRLFILACAITVVLFSLVRTHAATTLSPISAPLDLGASGEDVRTLQTLLASSPTVYPAGLITGYYGPLTKNAVAQFQIAYNLPAVGRVGPLTRTELNTLIGNGVITLDVNAPTITNVQVVPATTSVTISWNTTEMATGKVRYDASPIAMLEAQLSKTEPQVSGTAVTEQIAGTLHTLTINGLMAHQTYYYSIVSTDLSQNVSVTMPLAFLTK